MGKKETRQLAEKVGPIVKLIVEDHIKRKTNDRGKK